MPTELLQVRLSLRSFLSGMRLVGLLLAVAGILLLGQSAPKAEAATTVIEVGDNWFCSSSFQNGDCPTTIEVGDTISWDFSGAFLQHTATDCGADCNSPTGSPAFDSGLVPPNASKYQFTFNSPGTYPYYCEIHPTQMRGTITVASSVGGIASLPSTSTQPAQTAAGSGISTAVWVIASLAVVALALFTGTALMHMQRRR